MASPRIEYAVLPAGEGAGQDRCFTADGLVVVLDGASAYDPSVSPDASDYVDTLGPTLIEQITGNPGVDLRDALAEAIRQTAAKLQLIPGKGPSSTVSIVRWGADTVDVLVLGDSPVIVQFTDGHYETIVQHPMDHIAPELRQLYRDRLSAGHGYSQEHRALLAEIQRHEAPLRNQIDGYFITEADPSAAYKAAVKELVPGKFSAIVVASDGADSVFGNGEWSPNQLSDLAASDLETILRSLYDWENDIDPDGRLAPRSKRHDDKTIVVLSEG